MAPTDRKYAKSHEWILVDGNVGTIGITYHAQGELGDVVFVELPDTGRELEAGQEFGTIESVKAVSELFAPLSGEVVETNGSLVDQPELVNSDPYNDGWMIRIQLSDPGQIEGLMTAEDYEAYVNEESAV